MYDLSNTWGLMLFIGIHSYICMIGFGLIMLSVIVRCGHDFTVADLSAIVVELNSAKLAIILMLAPLYLQSWPCNFHF